MDVPDLLRAHGGFMRWKEITSACTERQLRRAVASGHVVRVARGYAVADAERGVFPARQLGGVTSHRSAASHWGLALPPGPDVEHITVPHKARRPRMLNVVLHYRDLQPDELVGGVTSPVQTVIDCLRDLPLRDALSVGDSALAASLVSRRQLDRRSAGMRGPGSRRARERVGWVDGRAANAFESSCRAILIDGRVTGFQPQLNIRHDGRFLGRVDLGNLELRIVIECESFAHHGERAALRRDCRRYTELESAGWLVLRVTWEQVMFEPEWVLARVRDGVALRVNNRRRRSSTAQRP